MRARIQPKPLEIPEDDPFANDLLGRDEPIELLTNLISNIEGPCVMAVDAPWGAGKTTFINLWHQYLCNKGFSVVKFNAWENDFSNDPFVALVEELASGFKGKKLDEFKQAGAEIMNCVALSLTSNVVKRLTLGFFDLKGLIKDLKGREKPGKKEFEKRLNAYGGAKSAMKKFRQALEGMVSSSENKSVKESTAGEAPQDSATSEGTRPGPLIVIIDELDRCRPSYAVELLEVAKHLFSVDSIVFVLAVNRRQLAHSIRGLYGEGFDAEDYLRRFFDVDFHLPEPDKKAFIDNLFNAKQISSYFDRTKDYKAKYLEKRGRTLLIEFSNAFKFTLRQIEQAVHRVGLVLALTPDNRYSFFLAIVAAMILRTIDTPLYRDFIDGKVSDSDVVDKIFSGREELKWIEAGCWFEAILILSFKEIARYPKDRIVQENKDYNNSRESLVRVVPGNTPLENKYRTFGIERKVDTEEKMERSRRVLELVERGLDLADIQDPFYGLDFIPAVRRLELLIDPSADESSKVE